MKQTVNRVEFISILAQTAGITKQEAAKQYDNYLAAMETAILTGKCVIVGNMYRIQAVMRKGGEGINPKTKEKVKRKPKPRLKCTLSTMYEDAVKKAISNE